MAGDVVPGQRRAAVETVVAELRAALDAYDRGDTLRLALAFETISRREQLATLRRALRPFADFRGRAPDHLVITNGSGMAKRQLTMGDCRAARDALMLTDAVG